jgi:hypothetical protein
MLEVTGHRAVSFESQHFDDLSKRARELTREDWVGTWF